MWIFTPHNKCHISLWICTHIHTPKNSHTTTSYHLFRYILLISEICFRPKPRMKFPLLCCGLGWACVSVWMSECECVCLTFTDNTNTNTFPNLLSMIYEQLNCRFGMVFVGRGGCVKMVHITITRGPLNRKLGWIAFKVIGKIALEKL